MEMQISNASEFPLYHSMASGPHSFQLPGAIPPVSTIPSYKNTMFPDRLGFYYDSPGVTHHHGVMPPDRCDRCYVELSVIGGAHHFGKKLCGMCASKEQQQVSPKVDTEILDLDSQQVMSQQQQQQQQRQQQQQQDTAKERLQFLQQQQQQHGQGGVVVPPGYDRPPPPPPPPAVEWPGYFQPQQNTLSGEHLSPDYNNVTTTTTTPPTMMGGSPPSDMQQQQYQGNFDGGGYAVDSNQQPGGGGGGGSGTKGNGSWKSNEARRAKTYECPACDKWFTSSGHLKRHYGTQLHKNAVKQSGKPDPALLPMKHHYHPYRDPAYVAQQKLKQQQQNGGGSSLHKQQQSSMQQMMQPADFRPVTSTSSFNTDSFLELTPPNLTASLSDSLGGTQFLPARRPVSSSSSSSSSNSNNSSSNNNNSMAGFTDETRASSYNSRNSNYPGDPAVAAAAVALTALRHRPVTSYHGHHPSSTAVPPARSAYQHHQITDTIQPYTTPVSMIQPGTNTDSYITMPGNNAGDGHRYIGHFPPPSYRHDHDTIGRNQQQVDYQPSSTTPSFLHQLHRHHQQQQQFPSIKSHLESLVKTEPVDQSDYGGGGGGDDDTPMASPDSSIDHHHPHHHYPHQHQLQDQQQHRFRGMLVVRPVNMRSPPPPMPLYSSNQHRSGGMSTDEEAAVSDSGGSVELDAPQSDFAAVDLPSPSSTVFSASSAAAAAKKNRKATRVTCELCNKDFTDKCYKTQHDQRFHSGEKPYRCGLCGKRFGEQKLLLVHELRHNDSNKAFACTLCTKSFNFKNDLDRHFMSSHSANKPYQCLQCKKKFVRLDHKRHHEKTHDGGGSGGGSADKTKNAANAQKKKQQPAQLQNEMVMAMVTSGYGGGGGEDQS